MAAQLYRHQRGEQGRGGDLVRGEAPAGAPAGDVARVRADEVGGEETVAGLDRAAQPDRLVVHGLDSGAGGGAVGLGRGHGGDERAQLGALHLGALGLHDRGEPAGHGAVGDRGGGSGGGHSGADRVGRGVQGAQQGGTRLGLCGEGAGHGRGGETGVGQGEPEGVSVADEAGVDEGDPL